MDPPLEGPPPLPELIASLERATLMAKQLLISAEPSHALQVHSSLQSLRRQIAQFLSQFHQSSSIPQLGGDPSVSSVIGQENVPMEIAEEGVASRVVLGGVEDSIRGFALKNKRRRKRPSSPTEDQKLLLREFAVLDPEKTRLKLLDLVFQFHG